MPNEAEQYGVKIEPAPNGASVYWKATTVRKLTSEESHGRHDVFIDVYDRNGQSCRNRSGVRIRHGWENEEAPDRKALDKVEGEPMTNVNMFANAKVWIEVESLGVPSEKVTGLTTALTLPGENWGHISYYVRFDETVKQVSTPTPPVAPPPAPTPPSPTQPPAGDGHEMSLEEVESVIKHRLNGVIPLIIADLAQRGGWARG